MPLLAEVAGAGETLGSDPLYVANEGRLGAFVAADRAHAALTGRGELPGGRAAAIVGEVRDEPPGRASAAL